MEFGLLEALNNMGALGGLGGVLAVVVFYYARRDALQHKMEWKENASRYADHTEVLVKIVQDSTTAITANTETSRTLVAAVQELRAEVTELRNSQRRS
jgi:hypothetical protein